MTQRYWEEENTAYQPEQENLPLKKQPMAFRMASDQFTHPMPTEGQIKILKHIENLNLIPETEKEPFHPVEQLPLKPVPMPGIHSEQNIDPGFYDQTSPNTPDVFEINPKAQKEKPLAFGRAYSQTTESPDFGHFIKDLETQIKNAREESDRKIAHYNQNGWPTYSANTVNDIVNHGINELNPQGEHIQQPLEKLGNPSYGANDILLAQASTDTGILSDASGLYAQRIAEAETESNPGHGTVESFHGRDAQKEANPLEQDALPSPEKRQEAKEPTQAEQKPELSPNVPSDELSRNINKIVGGKQGFETKVQIPVLTKLEGQEPGLYVPKGTTSSGVTIASGLDLSQHSREDLVKMGITDKTTLDNVDHYLSKNGKRGPVGEAARNLLKKHKKEGILDEDGQWKNWDEKTLDNIDKCLIPDKMDKGVTAYNKEAEKYPGAKKFHELSPEIQTIVISRFHQRQGNWNVAPDKKTKTEFFKVLMGIDESQQEKSMQDPEQLRLALSSALARDKEITKNNGLQNRYGAESEYLKDPAAWEGKYNRYRKK